MRGVNLRELAQDTSSEKLEVGLRGLLSYRFLMFRSAKAHYR